MISTTDGHGSIRMEEAGTINFQDAGDADEGMVIVRYDEKSVAICVSKASDDDLEVVLEASRKAVAWICVYLCSSVVNLI
ncbi:MAG: hypothetical protein ACREDQ_12290 [Limisphaerales bacterium]